MNEVEMDDLLGFARRLAEAARTVTLPASQAPIACEDKNEGGLFDPVTEADRSAERVMRTLIRTTFPDHGIEGEEMPPEQAAARRVWSLDPIDGTRAFLCGLPGWTTLIALMEESEPRIGLIDAPRLDEIYAGAGTRAWLIKAGGDAQGLRTSACRTLSEARLATTDPYLFSGWEAQAFEALRQQAKLSRYGFDAYAYARLAAGSIDLVAESGLKPHDWRALVPVIRGAGGVVGDWRGRRDLSAGQLLAAASQPLYDEAVELLSRV